MAATVSFFTSFKTLLGGGLNLGTADLRAIPLTNSYTFSAAHDYVNDLTNEVTTNGGARVALSSVSWAVNGSNARLDCADLAWTASGGSLTIRKIAVCSYTGSTGDADRPLLCLITFDADATAGDTTQVKLLTPNGLFEVQ